MSFWERYSPFSRICGRMLKDQLQEEPKKKFIAPKVIQPSASEIKIEIIERYYESLDQFLRYISNCRNIDIDTTIITSPALRMVTYSLKDAFQFLIQHEYRHINQAIRVKRNGDFPRNISDSDSKYPYDKDTIKTKILNIKADIEQLIQPACPEKFFC